MKSYEFYALLWAKLYGAKKGNNKRKKKKTTTTKSVKSTEWWNT